MFSTSMAISRMSLGRLGGKMASPKLPWVIRRHAAANAAMGRVTASRIKSPSAAAVPKNSNTIAPRTLSRQASVRLRSSAERVQAAARFAFCASKSARRWSNSALPRSVAGRFVTFRASGATLAIAGSA